MAVSPTSFAKLASKGNESVKDFVWTSNSQITLPASTVEINGSLYSSNDLVFDFANGTGDNGLDTGVEAAGVWYALYAVPGTGTAYKLKASANLPVEAGGAGPVGFPNYRYLGLFINGINSGGGATNTTDIVRFSKSGDTIILHERAAGFGSGDYAVGKLLGVNSQAPAFQVPYAFGMGAGQLPYNKALYLIYGACQSPGQNLVLSAYGGTAPPVHATGSGVDSGGSQVCGWVSVNSSISTGLQVNVSSGPTVQYIITVGGWKDPLLARRKM